MATLRLEVTEKRRYLLQIQFLSQLLEETRTFYRELNLPGLRCSAAFKSPGGAEPCGMSGTPVACSAAPRSNPQARGAEKPPAELRAGAAAALTQATDRAGRHQRRTCAHRHGTARHGAAGPRTVLSGVYGPVCSHARQATRRCRKRFCEDGCTGSY